MRLQEELQRSPRRPGHAAPEARPLAGPQETAALPAVLGEHQQDLGQERPVSPCAFERLGGIWPSPLSSVPRLLKRTDN